MITTIQEAFDKAWTWANRPDAEKCEVVHTNTWRECKYYDDETGNRCFFGALFSEPLARALGKIAAPWDEMLENLALAKELGDSELYREIVALDNLAHDGEENYRFFGKLQDAHDDPDAGAKWKDDAIANLRSLAGEFNLTVPS